jgi:hypothetical protein
LIAFYGRSFKVPRFFMFSGWSFKVPLTLIMEPNRPSDAPAGFSWPPSHANYIQAYHMNFVVPPPPANPPPGVGVDSQDHKALGLGWCFNSPPLSNWNHGHWPLVPKTSLDLTLRTSGLASRTSGSPKYKDQTRPTPLHTMLWAAIWISSLTS